MVRALHVPHQPGGTVNICCVHSRNTLRHVIFLHQIPAIPHTVSGCAVNCSADLPVSSVVSKTHAQIPRLLRGEYAILCIIAVRGIIQASDSVALEIVTCSRRNTGYGTSGILAQSVNCCVLRVWSKL